MNKVTRIKSTYGCVITYSIHHCLVKLVELVVTWQAVAVPLYWWWRPGVFVVYVVVHVQAVVLLLHILTGSILRIIKYKI